MEKQYNAEQDQPPHARRVSSPDVLLKRAALRAVGSVSDRISGWQSTAVRLRARYHFDVDADIRASVAAQAHDLLVEVREAARQLAEESEGLPPSVTNNGRYQDVVRALESIVAALESFAAPTSS